MIVAKAATRYEEFAGTRGPSPALTISSGAASAVSTILRHGRPDGERGIRKRIGSLKALQAM